MCGYTPAAPDLRYNDINALLLSLYQHPYALVNPSARYPGMRRWSEAARIGVARS